MKEAQDKFGLPSKEPINDARKIATLLQKHGWTKTPYFFSFGTDNTMSADFQKENKREFIYPYTNKDAESRKLLEEVGIPLFPQVKDSKTRPQNLTLTDAEEQTTISIEVPEGTRPLNWIKYSEQEPVIGHIGAIEIMSGVGKLLGRIYKKTNLMPQNIAMSKFAFVPFSKEFVRLIPPIELEASSDLQSLKEKILADLNSIDPKTNHAKQLEAFEKAFAEALLHG